MGQEALLDCSLPEGSVRLGWTPSLAISYEEEVAAYELEDRHLQEAEEALVFVQDRDAKPAPPLFH